MRPMGEGATERWLQRASAPSSRKATPPTQFSPASPTVALSHHVDQTRRIRFAASSAFCRALLMTALPRTGRRCTMSLCLSTRLPGGMQPLQCCQHSEHLQAAAIDPACGPRRCVDTMAAMPVEFGDFIRPWTSSRNLCCPGKEACHCITTQT